jgi:hypothetical protein
VFALQATIIANLKDPDVSIRRRALDLLFTMCDGGAAVEVVEELVRHTGAAWRQACIPLCACDGDTPMQSLLLECPNTASATGVDELSYSSCHIAVPSLP